MYHIATIHKLCWVDIKKYLGNKLDLKNVKINTLPDNEVDLYFNDENIELLNNLKKIICAIELGWILGTQRQQDRQTDIYNNVIEIAQRLQNDKS